MTVTAAATLLGRPLWFELMTTDTKAAEAFYDKVVGWTSRPFKESPQPYTTFQRSGDFGVAGLVALPEGMTMPPFWAMYIGVPDLEKAASHVTRLGGKSISPVIDVPTIGLMKMVQDPQGAAFYIYQPERTDHQPEGAPEVGEASWLELMTTDAPAAMKFYEEVFGWKPSQAMDMGDLGMYQMFDRPHGMIGGMMNKPVEMANVPPHWAIYFRVPDIDSAAQRITANGGKILNGPMEVPGGDMIVSARDPQGASFSLHAKKA